MTSKRSRATSLRDYLRRFFLEWVAEDPQPTHSALDKLDGRR